MKKIKFKVLMRILVSPFVFLLILVTYNLHAIRNTFMFLKHGGEWVTYAKDEKATMERIYDEVKKSYGTTLTKLEDGPARKA